MRTNNISLPYPVLGIHDDITPSLPEDSIKVEINSDLKDYIVRIDMRHGNADIERLINEGKALYTCECECAKTMYRKCHKSADPHLEITIPRKHVCGIILFHCDIVVIKPINAYRNRGFHEDYGDAAFDMEAGDILASFPEATYDTEIRYDKLQAAGSFMEIRKNENEEAEDTFFDLSGKKIVIQLPSKLYDMYGQPEIKQEATLLHSSLALNALTYALIQLCNNPEEYETKLWARTVLYRVKSEDNLADFRKDDSQMYDSQQAHILAQRLLKNPYQRLFNNLVVKNGKMMED